MVEKFSKGGVAYLKVGSTNFECIPYCGGWGTKFPAEPPI